MEAAMSHTQAEQTPDSVCKSPDPHPGMIRLPVAPRANHRIRFEALASKPASALAPRAARSVIDELMAAGSTVDTVLISGPGDPLADPELPLETISLLKEKYPALRIVLRTLGINGLQHADRFEKAGVSEVELLINGIQQEVLESIYAWVRPGFKTLPLGESIPTLISEQEKALQAFKDAGLNVRVITTYFPTVNDEHLPTLAHRLADLGADEMILEPYAPSPDADFLLPTPNADDIAELTSQIANYLPVTEGRPAACGPEPASLPGTNPKPKKERPNIAVVSSNGMDVDLHLGQAPQILVYGPRTDGLNCLLECRPAPSPGSGKERWDMLADALPDCFALLAASAGERPRKILDGRGIQVIITQDNIEGTVDTLYGGSKKGRGKRPMTT